MAGPTIFLSTAEFSGDMHGEVLIRELKKLAPQASFYGIGGAKMAAAGMELLYNSINRSTVGFIEVIKNLNKVKKLVKTITDAWEERRPDLVIWLDSGGFNLIVAKEAKKRGIPVVCMFSPSAWAYGEQRAVKLAERVSLLLAVLPFEADFYRKFGVNVTYVGHPLIDRVKSGQNLEVLRKSLGLTGNQKLVVLMPGSRSQEIAGMLELMLSAAESLNREMAIKWVLPVAASLDRSWLETIIERYSVVVELVNEKVYDWLAAADGAVITSGTATLEAAILNTPMVVVYRMSGLSVLIYKLLESKEHKKRQKQWLIALPNIIKNYRVVPELIQKELTAVNIVKQLRVILIDESYRDKLRRELNEVRTMVGPEGVMARAAGLIMEELKKGVGV